MGIYKEYKHSGERSTGESREKWAWGGNYYVLLKKAPKQIWKNVNTFYFGYGYKGVHNVIILSVRLKYFTIKHSLNKSPLNET